MAARVNRPLVSKYEEVRQNVQTFNEVLKGQQSLQANLLRFKSWYYVPELDAVAPSKFIGFADMTGDYYEANRKGGLNGGLTDPRLSRWFQGVKQGSSEYRYVFDKVHQLLADNGKAFRKKPHLRFNAPPGWKVPAEGIGIANNNLYIGGEWVDSSGGSSYEVRNPAHRYHVLAEVQAAGVEDAEKAISAAAEAASGWADTPAPQRADVLYRVHELMRERFEEFARLITLEEGKSLPDARGEVQRSLNIIQYAAGEGRRMFGYTTPSETRDTVAYTLRRPLGVVAIITPWNFPLAIPAWKIAPALICGNVVVFKPASSTPLSAIKLTETFIEAGLPPGVLNLVTGPGGSVGNYMVNHPDIAGISFTGSTEIGAKLYSQAAATLKKVQCEMGGKNAVIVLADADMEQAVGSVAVAAFGSTGQRCTATSRVIVEESVMDSFLEGLVERTKKMTVGDGLDSCDVGPVASEGQFEKIMEYINIGKAEGANLLHGGGALTGPEFEGGLYIEPTIFTNVEPAMRIAQEEIFGPVLTVFSCRDLAHAIEISNNVQFGLSSSIYTKDLPKAFRYIEDVEAGMVHVNAPTLGGEVHLPFGGSKASGVGPREQGTEAVNFFSEVVTVYVDYSGGAG